MNDIESENICGVCQNPAGGAHKCSDCGNIVHLICGKPIGDEGYGQSVKCNKCCGNVGENNRSAHSFHPQETESEGGDNYLTAEVIYIPNKNPNDEIGKV